MRFPSYLTRKPSGIFYFKIRIPVEIKRRYNVTKSEFSCSLHTHDPKTARKPAMRLWMTMENTDWGLARENEGRKLLKQLLKAELLSRHPG
jgi:hypothetical protein